MSNMSENQRAGFERATYSGSAERIRHGSEKGARIYTVVAAIVAVVLCAAALAVLDGWAEWVVLGGIVFAAIGFMVAVSPRREA